MRQLRAILSRRVSWPLEMHRTPTSQGVQWWSAAWVGRWRLMFGIEMHRRLSGRLLTLDLQFRLFRGRL